MSAELLKSMAGIDIVHIPYKGPGPALQDLLAGQVNMLFDTVASSLPQVRGGKLKGLAVTSPARLALASDIPAVAETLPGFEIAPWFGVLARAGTPPATVAKLQAEMARILALPDVRENLVGAQGMTIIASTPEAFAAYIDEEIARWAKVVKTIGVRPE
jgi:tripartite-type tricarboxylate transporter receptor subunit TctC